MGGIGSSRSGRLKFELGVGPLLCDFANPFGHGLAVAAGSCASDDDGDFEHGESLLPIFWVAQCCVDCAAMHFRHNEIQPWNSAVSEIF
jgi:hypothetical protein